MIPLFEILLSLAIPGKPNGWAPHERSERNHIVMLQRTLYAFFLQFIIL